MRPFRPLLVVVVLAAVAPRTARADEPEASPPPAQAPAPAPLVEVLFPNAHRVPDVAAAPPVAERPTPAAKPDHHILLAAGPALLGSGLGAQPTGALGADVPMTRRLGFRAWTDVPLGSVRVAGGRAVSEATLWTFGLGLVGSVTDPRRVVALRLHGGWGGVILHDRAVSADPASGLAPGRAPVDLFTLVGQVGGEIALRPWGAPVSLAVGARGGVMLTRLGIEHDPFDYKPVASAGPAFGALDARFEVKL